MRASSPAERSVTQKPPHETLPPLRKASLPFSGKLSLQSRRHETPELCGFFCPVITFGACARLQVKVHAAHLLVCTHVPETNTFSLLDIPAESDTLYRIPRCLSADNPLTFPA